MKRFLYWTLLLLILVSMAGIVLLVLPYKETDEILLLKLTEEEVTVYAQKGNWVFLPRRLLVPRAKIKKIQPAKNRVYNGFFSMQPATFVWYGLAKSDQPQQNAIQIELVLRYSVTDSLQPEIASHFFDANGFDSFFSSTLKNEISVFIQKSFANENSVQNFADRGSSELLASLRALAAAWKERGIEVSSIEFGSRSNITAISHFLKNVYLAPDLVASRKKMVARLQEQEIRHEIEKKRLLESGQLDEIKTRFDLIRLEKYAKFLEKFPHAYKLMFLEKLGGNLRVLVVPANSNLLDLNAIEPKPTKTITPKPVKNAPQKNKKEAVDKQQENNLGPGEFLTK